MPPERKYAYRGSKFKIEFARSANGESQAEAFFDGLPKSDQAKLIQLFELIGDHGKHNNPEKFGELDNGLYEFKSFQIRMPYAYAAHERGLILITHGFFKKSKKTPKTEIERAKRILEAATPAKIYSINDHKQKGKRP